MTPQSSFMVLAPLAEGREASLRALLAAMNLRPGLVNPRNELVPFGEFERLHFARFVIVEAPTAGDLAVYDMPPAPWPTALAFLGDCDGPADSFLADLVARAGGGLRRIFACCRDFPAEVDLLAWMKRHEHVAVRELRQLDRAHGAPGARGAGPPPARWSSISAMAAPSAPESDAPLVLRDRLVRFVAAERRPGG